MKQDKFLPRSSFRREEQPLIFAYARIVTHTDHKDRIRLWRFLGGWGTCLFRTNIPGGYKFESTERSQRSLRRKVQCDSVALDLPASSLLSICPFW